MVEAHIQGQRANARCDWVETCHTSKALCRKCRNAHCHSVDIQTGWWEVLRSVIFSSGDILRAAYNHPVWDQSSDWWRVYGGQSVEKNCKGECQCEPHFALQPWVCPSICHSECWNEWQCDTTLTKVCLKGIDYPKLANFPILLSYA